MLRSTLTVVLLLIVSSAFAFPPESEYLPGKAYVKFIGETVADGEMLSATVPRTGISGMDAVLIEFNVYRIEKAFPLEEKPDNPLLVDLSRWYILHFPEEIAVEDIVTALSGLDCLECAEPWFIRRVCYTPDDPHFGSQWHLTKILADSAWDITSGSEEIAIAFIDTGIDSAHEDLHNNLWVNPGEDLDGNGTITPEEVNGLDDDENGFTDDFWGWDFVENDNTPWAYSIDDGHGTMITGVGCADTDNGIGVSGVGFNSKNVPVKVGTGGFIYYGLQGISYAFSTGVDIVNLSYGSSFYSVVENDLIQLAHLAGCVICASGGSDNSTNSHYPAGYDNVIGVGSTDQDDHKASFSNYNPPSEPFFFIDVMAPGVNILSTQFGGEYLMWNGTSMSAPITAGVCALIKSVNPDLTNVEIEEILFSTCFDIYPLNPGYEWGQLGWGRVDAYAAVLAAQATLSAGDWSEPVIPGGFEFAVYPNPFNNEAQITFELAAAAAVSADIFNVAGQKENIFERQVLNPGGHAIPFNPASHATGIYFVSLTIKDNVFVKKVVLLK